jgi:hypothetical protein
VISHPYERLGVRPLASAAIGLTVFWALLTAILAYEVPAALRAQITQLLSAENDAAATAILLAWGPEVYRAFSFMLGFDFLYDIVHNNAVAFLAIWGAKRVSAKPALFLGAATAWVMWLDTALNLFENVAFLHIIRSLDPWPLLPAANAVFVFRTGTWVLGIVLAVALHGFAYWRSRNSAVRRVSSRG